jgi:plasmid segregation protein ParM
MSKPILVAVDGGSGNISISFDLDGKNKIASIPARIRQGNAQTTDKESPNTWHTVNEHGENALYSVVKRGTDLIDTCDPDYQISAAHRVLVVNALAEMGLGGRDIIIGETLPANQYYGRESINHKRISAKVNSLMQAISSYTGELKTPRILGVKVYPEAVPAVFSASVNSDGVVDPRWARVKGKLVVDIGRFTCDIVYLDENNNVVAKFTSENGVHTMLKDIHEMLINDAEKLGIRDAVSIQLDAIDGFIRDGNGKIASGWDDSDAINITPYIERAAARLTHAIQSDIRSCWRDLLEVDVIIVVGGGANYVAGKLAYLKEQDLKTVWGRPVHVPDYPESSIVCGVHMVMKANEAALIAQFSKTEA